MDGSRPLTPSLSTSTSTGTPSHPGFVRPHGGDDYVQSAKNGFVRPHGGDDYVQSASNGHMLPHGGGSYGHPHSGGKVPSTNCLEKVLKTDVKNLLASLQKLFCSYENCKGNKCSLEEWTQMLADVKQTLKDTGCAVDELLLGGKPTVEQIAAEVGKLLQQLRDPVRELLIHLKVEEPVFKLLCKLLGDVLLCLGDLLGNLTDELNLGGITSTVNKVAGGILGPLTGLGI